MSCLSGSPGSGHMATRRNRYDKWYLNSPSTQRLRRGDLKVEADLSEYNRFQASLSVPGDPVWGELVTLDLGGPPGEQLEIGKEHPRTTG